jgi:hypothetical protein
LIPAGAKTLREAVLIDSDFSCLSSEDYVCSLAVEISDRLINTFKDVSTVRHRYALIPKGMPIPIIREEDGNPRCQCDFNLIAQSGLISLEF